MRDKTEQNRTETNTPLSVKLSTLNLLISERHNRDKYTIISLVNNVKSVNKRGAKQRQIHHYQFS